MSFPHSPVVHARFSRRTRWMKRRCSLPSAAVTLPHSVLVTEWRSYAGTTRLTVSPREHRRMSFPRKCLRTCLSDRRAPTRARSPCAPGFISGRAPKTTSAVAAPNFRRGRSCNCWHALPTSGAAPRRCSTCGCPMGRLGSHTCSQRTCPMAALCRHGKGGRVRDPPRFARRCAHSVHQCDSGCTGRRP